MKKISKLVPVVLLIFVSQISFSQKGQYTDVGKLSETKEYKAAQTELDELSLAWKTEIETKYNEVDKLCKAFYDNTSSLTDTMKKNYQSEIEEKLKAAKKLQIQHFGFNGDLFKKREELMKCLQG